MGALRLTLAIAVVLAHVEGSKYMMTGGATSVQSFYIISGFFMAMILDVKYNHPDQTGLFYSNRLLRIFPLYWLFLVISLVFHGFAQFATHHSIFNNWSQYLSRMRWEDIIFLASSNLFIIGQDLVLFMKLGSYGLHWSTSFQTGSPPTPAFLFLPQAWSLAIELSFYLLAPWILRRRTVLILSLCLLSVGVRYVLWHAGLREDPWSYRFFPSELGTFLAGSLAYRLIYLRIKACSVPLVFNVLAFGVFPAIFLYPFYGGNDPLFFQPQQMLFYLYVAFAVPFLFRLTGRVHFDRRVGELSFPVYLCHSTIVLALDHFASHLPNVMVRALLAVGLSIALAYFAVIYFDEPLDQLRQKRIERNRRQRGDVPVAPGTVPLAS